MAAYRPARLAELPPFTSGAVGCVAYDAVRYVERLPHAPPDDLGLPDLSFAFYDRMVVFDHVTKGVDVVVLARIEGESASAVDAAYDVACRRVDETIERLAGAGGADARRGATPSWPPLADIGPRPVIDSAVLEGDGAVRSGFDRAAFEAAVERARRVDS